MALLSGTDSHASSALLAHFLMCLSKDGQCHSQLAALCRGAPEPAPRAPCPHAVRCRSRRLRSVRDAERGCPEKGIRESSRRPVKCHLQLADKPAVRMEPVAMSSGVGWRGGSPGPPQPSGFQLPVLSKSFCHFWGTRTKSHGGEEHTNAPAASVMTAGIQ